MATSHIPNSKFTCHTRSISLPTSSHPLLATAEEHLLRFKSSQAASSSTSHTSTCQKLDALRNLYECLDDLLQLPFSHQQLTRERNGTWELEDILDASIRLLDICATTREVYSMMKESVQELESSLRRKGSRDMDSNIVVYMTSKKMMIKMIIKCFKELKRSEKICSLTAANSSVSVAIPMVNLIKEVQEISLNTLKSTLSLISEPMSQSGAWTLVSKVLQSKGDQSNTSEIQKFEEQMMLLSSKNFKYNKDCQILPTQHLLKQLGALDSNIQEVAELLEVTFRIFLKTRTSLLNILNL